MQNIKFKSSRTSGTSGTLRYLSAYIIRPLKCTLLRYEDAHLSMSLSYIDNLGDVWNGDEGEWSKDQGGTMAVSKL